jgi:TP901 family phage tail tape measure protein
MADATLAFNILTRYRDAGARAAARDMDRLGNSGSRMSTALMGAAKVGGTALAVALVGVTTKAVSLEAEFSKTMNTMAAVADVPQEQIKKLSDLAMKMGADTVFSANDAASAMLELAKNGISPAVIQSGALKSALTLAAAGGIDMASAATTMGNALNTFGLKGKQAGQVAAALAGGSNASSASISSLAEALAQVGPGATNAGMSIQETVGALSAFANAGIAGGRAGTSLKIMLSRLVPQTDKAKNAMKDAGLNFVNANGSFKSLSDISGQLHDKLGKLSDAERTRALSSIFGADASRAATVLMNEGSKGIEKYTKATSDQGAANRVAAATMKGTAGAIESLKGSLETATLQFGLFIAPAVQAGLHKLTAIVNGIVPAAKRLGGFLKSNVVPVVKDLGATIGGQLKPVLDAVVVGFKAFVPVLRDAAEMFTSTILPAIISVASYIGAKLMPVFTKIADIVMNRVVPILADLGSFIVGTLVPAVVAIYSQIAKSLKPVFDQLVETFQAKVLPALDDLLAKFHEWQPTIEKVIMVVVKVNGWVLKFAAAILGKVLPVVIRLAGWLLGILIPVIIKVIDIIIKVVAGFIKGFQAIANIAKWLWNNALQPLFKFLAKGIAMVMEGWAMMLGALGHVPGFGWAKEAAVAMGKAADAANRVADNLNKIKDKTVHVTVAYQYTGLKDPTRGHDLGAPSRSAPRPAGLIDSIVPRSSDLARSLKNRIILTSAGVSIMESLVKGIESKKTDLVKVLDKVTGFIKAQADKIKGLVSDRNSFASGFKSFTSSAFSQDFTNPDTGANDASAAGLIEYQKAQKAKAEALKADVQRLVKMGLSKDLIQQLAASGEQGIAQIHALAGGSAADVAQLNTLNAQTNAALTAAGMAGGNKIYGDKIDKAREAKATAEAIARELRKHLDDRDKNTQVVLKLDGHSIQVSLLKLKRHNGKNLGLT